MLQLRGHNRHKTRLLISESCLSALGSTMYLSLFFTSNTGGKSAHGLVLSCHFQTCRSDSHPRERVRAAFALVDIAHTLVWLHNIVHLPAISLRHQAHYRGAVEEHIMDHLTRLLPQRMLSVNAVQSYKPLAQACLDRDPIELTLLSRP